MSNYSHVFQEFRPIVEQSNEDRLYFLEEDRWIGYEPYRVCRRLFYLS